MFDITLAIIMLIIWIVVLYGVGLIFPENKDIDGGFTGPILKGVVLCFAYFEVIALICIYIGTRFTTMMMLFFVPLAGICVFGYIKGRKRVVKSFCDMGKNATPKILLILPALLLIGFQIYKYVYFAHYDLDDAQFVAMSVTATETNTLFKYSWYTGELLTQLPSRYCLSPFYFLYGAFARLMGMSPTVMAHTYLPALLVPLAYLVYWAWARKLFPERVVPRCVFMLIMSVLQIYGYYTFYSESAFFLARIWQGKSVLCAILFPLILLQFMEIWKTGCTSRQLAVLLATMTAACLVSSMGVVLGAIMVYSMWVVTLIKHRSFKKSALLLLAGLPNLALGVCYIFL